MSSHSDGLEADLTHAIIGCAFEVSNLLGAGFLEKVYHRALVRELCLRGLKARSHATFPVRYKGVSVGDYVADLVIEGKVVVELKCVDRLAREHMAQCINYLKASGLNVALLLNFQNSKLEWKRIVRDSIEPLESQPLQHETLPAA